MNACSEIRDQFSPYLDGRVTGVAMHAIAEHLQQCPACDRDFQAMRDTQSLLMALGPAKVPADLGLKLRVALSQEHARSPRESLGRWQVQWHNTGRPLVLRASAGMASAVFLLGTFALLIGMFATPVPVEARDEPLTMSTTPHLLYSALEPDRAIGLREDPLVVEVYIGAQGKVYDYRILAGQADAATRAQLENVLLFSIFEPARTFDQPVHGKAVMSFSGVSVRG